MHIRHRDRTAALHRFLTVGALLVGAAVLLVPSDGVAQRRIEFLGGGQGVLDVVPPAPSSPGGTLRVHGEAHYDPRGGLRVGKVPVVFTRTTGVFPGSIGSGRSLDPRRLAGRKVTVYGKRGATGLQAALVIVDASENHRRATGFEMELQIEGLPDPDSFRLPSEGSDPHAGRLTEDAPR